MFRENKYVYGNQVEYIVQGMLGCKGTGINNVLGVYQGMHGKSYGINVKVGLMAVVMAIV